MVTEVIKAGATTINLPDTVGYAVPNVYADLVRYVIEHTPNADKAVFSVHCHDDLGLGVANTLAALQAGARQAEVTLSGIGERAGNTSLEEVVMALKVRNDVFRLDTHIRAEQLFPSCRLLSMIIGQPIPANKAIVGGNAFAHESGIHQDGMLKNRETYEIMTPQSIGRTSTDLVIGKHSGRNAVRNKLEALGYASLSDDQFQAVFEAIKALADKKKAVHDEDIEALIMGEVYRIPDRYKLKSLSVQSATSAMPATAAVVLQDGEAERRLAGFGVGAVDAAFNVIATMLEWRAPSGTLRGQRHHRRHRRPGRSHRAPDRRPLLRGRTRVRPGHHHRQRQGLCRRPQPPGRQGTRGKQKFNRGSAPRPSGEVFPRPPCPGKGLKLVCHVEENSWHTHWLKKYCRGTPTKKSAKRVKSCGAKCRRCLPTTSPPPWPSSPSGAWARTACSTKIASIWSSTTSPRKRTSIQPTRLW